MVFSFLRALRGEASVSFFRLGTLGSCAVLFLDVAEKYFGLRDVRVGVADARGKIVGDVARYDARITPVPREPDLVDRLTFDKERLKPFGHQSENFDGTARAADDHLVAVFDPFALGQCRADLDDGAGHEACEPG